MPKPWSVKYLLFPPNSTPHSTKLFASIIWHWLSITLGLRDWQENLLPGPYFCLKFLRNPKCCGWAGVKAVLAVVIAAALIIFYDLFCFNKVYLSVQFGFVFQVQVKEKSIVCARTHSNYLKHEEKPSHTFTLVWRKYFFPNNFLSFIIGDKLKFV